MPVNVSKKGPVTVEVVLTTSKNHRHGAYSYHEGKVYVVSEALADELLSLEYNGEPFFTTPNKVKHGTWPRVTPTSQATAGAEEDITKDDGGAATNTTPQNDGTIDTGAGAAGGDTIQIT